MLSLRDVDGGVLLYGGAEPVDNPLAGFSALEEATQVRLQGLTLYDCSHSIGGGELEQALPEPVGRNLPPEPSAGSHNPARTRDLEY